MRCPELVCLILFSLKKKKFRRSAECRLPAQQHRCGTSRKSQSCELLVRTTARQVMANTPMGPGRNRCACSKRHKLQKENTVNTDASSATQFRTWILQYDCTAAAQTGPSEYSMAVFALSGTRNQAEKGEPTGRRRGRTWRRKQRGADVHGAEQPHRRGIGYSGTGRSSSSRAARRQPLPAKPVTVASGPGRPSPSSLMCLPVMVPSRVPSRMHHRRSRTSSRHGQGRAQDFDAVYSKL